MFKMSRDRVPSIAQTMKLIAQCVISVARRVTSVAQIKNLIVHRMTAAHKGIPSSPKEVNSAEFDPVGGVHDFTSVK